MPTTSAFGVPPICATCHCPAATGRCANPGDRRQPNWSTPGAYPTIFNTADVAIVTKVDLAAAVECNLAAARANIQAVRPGMQILEVSSKTGAGMDAWLALLQSARQANDTRE